MIGFIEALIENPLLQTALLAGFAASVASGIVGSYVVVKRIAFISGSIAHSVLGGMGLCLWLQRTQGIESATPLLGALIAAIVSAMIIGWIHLKYRQREDSVIATLWSTGMAIGVLFISQTPGFNVELMSFLLGNILWVSHSDVWMLVGLDFIILATALILHKRLLLICFDEEQAYLQGLPVHALYLLLLILIAVSVVLLIQVVGIILAITMLTLPATIAGIFTQKLSKMMAGAIALSIFFSSIGTYFSYDLDWPTGATIALVASFFYLLCLIKPKRLFKITR
jgi:zinc transport system permease protein